MKASAIALAVLAAPAASTLSGTYKGSVPFILDCSVTFPGDGTMDFDQNVKVASTEVKCPTEKITETDSLVTFPEAGNDGDCLGDALRGQSKDPSKFSMAINDDETLTFRSDGWPDLKLKKQSLAGAPKVNIVELAESVSDLSTLVAGVVAADLVDTLSSPGPFTVFAPTNEAFAALPEDTLVDLMKPENKDQLVDILTYHVLPEQVLSTDLQFFQRVETVEGKNLHVIKLSSGVHVGPDLHSLRKVTGADNLASNGVAHIIDGVMLPPQQSLTKQHKPNIVELAESVKDLSTLVSAVVAADLVDTLSSPGRFTVFAPTNAAFGALPAGTLDSLMKPENKGELVDILTYHVLPALVLAKDVPRLGAVATVEGKNLIVQKNGAAVTVGPSMKDQKKVTAADNIASNGVAHIIDGVMLPPAKSPTVPNIVELAESVKDLSTLVSAVVAADLADTLSSKGPFTVFAPTNEGFAALPAGTLDDLMKPENKAQLADILTYHVLPVQAFADDLDLFQAATTVEGKPLHVTKWGGQVKVGPSLKSEDLKTVTAADNAACNGVVHIIDGVLIPPSAAVVV